LISGEQQYFDWETASQSTKGLEIPNIWAGYVTVSDWLRLWSDVHE